MGKAQIKPHFVAWSLLEPISIPVALGPLGSLPRGLYNGINGLEHGEGWVPDPFLPPLAHRKPEIRSLTGPFFFLFQRGSAMPSDFQRLALRPKSVSERPVSLSIRLSSKSRRIQKMTHFQCVGGIELRRSCRGIVCSRCERRHPKAAWLCG
jgi:hypothetical protein